MKIEHTQSFDLAYRFVTETNLNIFLTGKAGTGKTTFLKYLRDTTLKRMAIAAPTGVAAINAGGVTLHSLFQLPFGPFIPASGHDDNGMGARSLLSKIRYNKEKINFIHNLELLVIDEVSMVSSFLLDAIDTILRSIRRKHNLPFGGVQVLLIGDLYQLQPVVKRDEWQILKKYYSSIFFFDSHVFKNNPPITIELKEIFRQKDERFVEILNQIRNNNLEPEKFELLNQRLRKNFIPPDNEGYITLTTHNQQAKIINDSKLARLNGEAKTYKAEISGDFPEQMFPAELELILKEGAQVMFIKNDTEEKKYFNGKIGTVQSLSEKSINVSCGEEIIRVERQEWDNIKYSIDAITHEMNEEILGTFQQFPLRLAWAITIHKSQGLTFNKLVIDAENAFANGQVYVALSRATSLEGLVLTSPVNRQFLGAHRDLKQWQEKNYDDNNLEKRFVESRQQFCRNELAGIFTWNEWTYNLRNLDKVVGELNDELSPEAKSWIKKLTDEYKELHATAEKFVRQIFEYSNVNPVIEENAELQERIKKAALYFLPAVEAWHEKLKSHPLSVSNKRSSGKLDGFVDEIHTIVSEIKFKIGLCKEGFTLNEYLQNRKELKLEPGGIRSAYAKRKTEEKEEGDVELYSRLADLRLEISERENIPLFRVFSNKTMKSVSAELPADLDSLLCISGFGDKKVKAYGLAVIKIIAEYCSEKGFEPRNLLQNEERIIDKNSGSNGDLTTTVESTISLAREGKNIFQICSERGLAQSTIEGHLAKGIQLGKIKIGDVLSEEEIKRVASILPEGSKLSNIQLYWKDLPEGVSYGRLKMVLASMERDFS